MIYYNMKYIIYKIQIKDYIYIGSTQNFTVRKNKHKKNCNNEKEQRHNCLVYKTIRDNGGWDCCTMVPVKEIEVESKTQARILEEEMRLEYNAQMNTRRAYISEEGYKDYWKEYNQTEEHKAYNRQRNQTEERKEYRKQYQQTPEYKVKRKEYQQTPEYKEYQKQYRLAKKAKLADSPEIKVEV
jgi:hypothetical protein